MPRNPQDSLNQAQVNALSKYWEDGLGNVTIEEAAGYTHGFICGALNKGFMWNFPEDSTPEYRVAWASGYLEGYELTKEAEEEESDE